MTYYSYEATWYNPDTNETINETGISAADNFSAAAADLVEFYGEDTLEALTIAPLADTPLKVDKETIKKIAEDVIW